MSLAALRTGQVIHQIDFAREAAYLAGYLHPGQLETSRKWRVLVEAFVCRQLQAVCETVSPKPQFFFWRTRTAEEGDIICQHGCIVKAFEIKSGAELQHGDTVGLQSFMKQHEDCRCGMMLSSGDHCWKLTGSNWKVPIKALWAP
ncbi:MAG TPA: hypothetical protein PLN61_06265 [bacterium]|nr:hypothetical protein [bacterium]HQI48253.1 hypothetical protein [bacterium]HQJ65985.1 hypothetical protein [bacterium]